MEPAFPLKKTILSLCDFSGNWPKFYKDAADEYDVICVDLKHGHDIRTFEFLDRPIYGILAAPPCTAFAVSGAQYWAAKDASGETLEALGLVDACLRAIAVYRPKFWALENPVGRLRRYLGPPTLMFDPCDYGGWGDEKDAYTKKTLLWGTFQLPEKKPIEPIRVCSQGSWLQKLGGKSEKTKELRSMTPLGFARAFFEANR